MEKKIKLKTLNPFISCKICRGYLIDATTIVECLHTCKYQFSHNFSDFFLFIMLLYFLILLHQIKIIAAKLKMCLYLLPVCKSCLVKHLEESPNNACPDCNLIIHQSHPLQYISHDRTMQDIVYKLVPNLQDSKSLPHHFYLVYDANLSIINFQMR